MLDLRSGGKFIDRESNTVYIIRNIKAEKVILVSEDGEASMLLQQDSIESAGLEPILDWVAQEKLNHFKIYRHIFISFNIPLDISCLSDRLSLPSIISEPAFSSWSDNPALTFWRESWGGRSKRNPPEPSRGLYLLEAFCI